MIIYKISTDILNRKKNFIMENFRMIDNTKIFYTGKAILIGLLVGLIVSVFRLIIEKLLFYVKSFYLFFAAEPLWLIPWGILSIIIALLIGFLIKKDPNITGSGIPQVEGQLLGEIHCNWWSVLWKKFVGGILSIGSGLFLGREGPSIQLGASIGQGISEFFQGDKMEKKVLISSGASAGLAAAFNAPIAGLLFVLEEIHHNFSPLVLLTSLASAITANFISLNFFGLKPVLYLGEVPPFPVKKYGLLILLGIFLGFFGLLYSKVLLSLPKIYGKISFLPPYFYGIIPFLFIIPIGVFFPELLGGGSEIIFSLEKTSPTLMILTGLFILRFIFSMISYGGNLPGGIFLPILSLGAILGYIYGNMVIDITKIDAIYIRSFVMFSMAGYFTAIGKAPLTAMILVTEMVGSLNHLMPLAVVSFVSYIIVDLAGADPIYEALLENMIEKKSKILKGRSEIIEIPVGAESILDGKMIREINWPAEALITSIRRGSKQIIAHGDTVMHVGDCLIVLTDEGMVNQVRQQIKHMSKDYIRG